MSTYDRWAALADREAIGEELTDEDRAFLRDHVRVDSLAAAESDLWESMSDWPELEDPTGDRAMADRAVRAVSGHRKSSGKVIRWVAVAALAAAAGLLVYAGQPRPQQSVAEAGPEATIEFVASGVRISGVAAQKGAHAAVGAEIEAVGGPVCVALEKAMHACLPAGGKARLTQFGAAERRVDLVAGRIAVALNKLPPGERFSIVANGATSTAVGTAFTVELKQAAVETIVHEGKVLVSQGAASQAVAAHRIGLVKAGAVELGEVTNHAATVTEDWVALASVSGRSIEAAWQETAAAAPVELPRPEEKHVVPAAPAAHVATRVDAPAPKAPEAAAPAPEAAPVATVNEANLLATARQALREQRWTDAVTAYRALVSQFPESPEARTAIVPLAKLELDRVGQSQAALDHLDAYIRTGGSLAVEARLTRIRALRALGRGPEEAQAIDEFLAEHPNSLDAAALRTRRSVLGRP